ncbi:hypothetical protein P280DRAFT_186354 [Massarina eburnea CBS 473.64]|uniref:Uncharacterized protein n=1 Tax=Massarina eburnea CBS 473.64 TaxID=1395130 RepID=A0A6A6SDW9_9PLEO|nr:hypothetical protein P280DRAFT_186354 [Massarina eburnea CBS 473.64]
MSAPCYAINGSDHNRDVVPFVPDEPKWVPCNNTAVGEGKHSACCALGDVCLTNGLCQNPADYWNGGNAFWTEGCTDKTFNDPACPDYCAERWFGMAPPDFLSRNVLFLRSGNEGKQNLSWEWVKVG